MTVLILIINLITFLVAFFLGRYSIDQSEVQTIVKKLKKKQPLGAVRRPTAQEVAKRGTKEEETEKIMERTFGRILK